VAQNMIRDDNKSIQILMISQPLVQQHHHAHYLFAAAWMMLWDPCRASKRAFRNTIERNSLANLGLGVGNFPTFVGTNL
jgi:hypothetical protein